MALERRVHLTRQDWARIPWRPPLRPVRPRRFDLEACLKEAHAALARMGRHAREISWPPPPRLAPLSSQEACFWLQYLEQWRKQGWHRLNVHNPREWALIEAVLRTPSPAPASQQTLSELASSWLLDAGLPLLRPFLTPLEIVQQLVIHRRSPACGPFATQVAVHLCEAERAPVRAWLEEMIETLPVTPPSTVGQPRPQRDAYLALLACVGGGPLLARYIAHFPDRAWADAPQSSDRSRKKEVPRNDPHIDLLIGLPDAATFLQEARRLGSRPRTPEDARLWLGVTQWHCLRTLQEVVEASTQDAAALARVLALVEAPEAAEPMLALCLGSRAPAIACAWLTKHPLHAAVGLVPTARGAGPLAEAAREHLAGMVRTHPEVLQAACAHLEIEARSWLQAFLESTSRDACPEAGISELPAPLATALTAVEGRAPAWIIAASLPPILWQGRRLADEAVCQVLASINDRKHRDSVREALRAHVEPSSLDAFAGKLLERAAGTRSPIRDLWMLRAVAGWGGEGCVQQLIRLVNAWSAPATRQPRTRVRRCMSTLMALGTDSAATALDVFSYSLPLAPQRRTALHLLRDLAWDRQVPLEELRDRIVPDLGFREEPRMLDLGSRQLEVRVDTTLQPVLRDAAGRHTRLPPARPGDDPDKVRQAGEQWEALTEALQALEKAQSGRMEQALITGRSFARGDVEQTFIRHPLMRRFLQPLVFAAFDQTGAVSQTFRITAEGCFADVEDTEIPLPGGCLTLAHPVYLSEELTHAWLQRLADYRLVPPFPQLTRAVYRPHPDDLAATELTHFPKRQFAGASLCKALNRLQWKQGQPSSQHHRHFPRVNITASIHYDALWNSTIKALRFHLGTSEYKPSAVPIGEVDVLVLSETLHVVHSLLSFS